jgi:hypothetical protein
VTARALLARLTDLGVSAEADHGAVVFGVFGNTITDAPMQAEAQVEPGARRRSRKPEIYPKKVA